MRVVFDTNVVVSALVFGRRLAWLRLLWVRGSVVPLVCRETTDELLRVLRYPKFRLGAADRETLLGDYLPHAEIVTLPSPPPELPVACRDRDDAAFVQLALSGAAAALVPGDADVAALRGTVAVPILSLREFRDRVAPGD